MNQEPLRRVETHSAGEESAGSAFGFVYELLWFALSGVGASGLIVSGLFWTGHSSFIALGLACVPAALTLGLAAFRQSHPKGFDSDLLDLWMHGPGFGPNPPDNLWL